MNELIIAGTTTELCVMGAVYPVAQPAQKPARDPYAPGFCAHDIYASAVLDATATTPKNQRHWQYATDADADEIANESERMVARMRCRQEYLNSGYVKNAVRNFSTHIIGKRGPQIKLQIDDTQDPAQKLTKDEKNHIEWAFFQWSKKVKLAKKLRMMVGALMYDGECFLRFVYDPHIRGTKLNVQVISAKRISRNGMGATNEYELDGIVYDEFDHPKQYWIQFRVPNPNFNYEFKPKPVPASHMLHLANLELPEQHRGLPILKTTLEKIAQVRRWDTYSLGAAEQAARCAGVMQTNVQPNSGDSAAAYDGPTTRMLPSPNPGQIYVMAEGWNFQQTKAEYPVNNHGDFVNTQITEFSAGIGEPAAYVMADCSNYNYSSWRGEKQFYWNNVEVIQADLEDDLLDPIFHRFLYYYAAINKLTKAVLDRVEWDFDLINRTWQFPVPESADPEKDAKADELKLKNMTTSRTRICAKNGEEFTEIAKELMDENAVLLNKFTDDIVSSIQQKMLPAPDVAAEASGAGGQATGEATAPSPQSAAPDEAAGPPPTPEELPSMLNTAEIAEKMNVTPGQISGWRKLGMPFAKLGSRFLYRFKDVSEWIKGKFSGKDKADAAEE